MSCEEIEEFFGVYLLYCTNPKYKGQTYIGFTVDPNRRIKQHNTGMQAGGARRTSNRGPWEMVLIIHGFPNNISALRFEWAWQNPHRSRRLRHLNRKTNRERKYDARLKVLAEMLRTCPWSRLPLTIRWLNLEYERSFQVDCLPPMHMSITHGAIVRKQLKKKQNNEEDEDMFLLASCDICSEEVEEEYQMNCLQPDCDLCVHIACLAKKFLGNDAAEHLIPIEGNCPKCDTSLLWGHLVRKKLGCQDLGSP